MVCSKKQTEINLSFSGCGFLGMYHIGVVCAFKEHAPEVLENKMAGCSAGSLAAACSMCGCCLGQMCSDALEIAIRARSRALGPLHPTFNLVEIIRNGLRRILPPNAHEICSGRLFISLTRWKDNKNVIVNQYQSREELIQVLICSSFVPYYSGIFPPKFREEYYWDGGLTNNNPIIDEGTILVSPFAGESDICPRDESGSFYSLDFSGTDISFTQENLYRMTRALFPPSLGVLKQLCWRGYVDGLKFLQTRNLIHSSYVNTKTSISSVLGSDYTEPAQEEETELANGGIAQNIDQMYAELDDINEESMDTEDEEESHDGSVYQSDEESNAGLSQATFSPYCEKVTRKKELPTSVFAAFATAREKEEEPIRNYFTRSRIYKVWSLMALPVTLPIDLTYAATKRVLGIFRSSPNATERTLPNRAANFLWSYLGDPNEDQSCYHVNDCECTTHHDTSLSHSSVRIHRRPQRQSKRRQLRHSTTRSNRYHTGETMSTITSTSSSSTSPTNVDDDDDDDAISTRNTTPDQLLESNFTKTYCHQLQEMADLANHQRAHQSTSELNVPFFGQDDPVMNTQTDPTPMSNLEKNVLFN